MIKSSLLFLLVTSSLGLATEIATEKAVGTAESKARARTAVQVAEDLRSVDQAELDVKMQNNDNTGQTDYSMKILRAKGRRALIEFLAPKAEVGRKMLAVKNSYWATFPDSKRVTSISRREMIGNSAFALADLFQMDTDNDYDPDIVKTEAVNGKSCLLLELKAKHSEAPYHRILYHVEETGFFPVQARFFGVSGKHLKTMTVEKRAKLNGKVRPSVLKMIDAVTKNKSSLWTTKKITPKTLSDKIFSVQYLSGQ